MSLELNHTTSHLHRFFFQMADFEFPGVIYFLRNTHLLLFKFESTLYLFFLRSRNVLLNQGPGETDWNLLIIRLQISLSCDFLSGSSRSTKKAFSLNAFSMRADSDSVMEPLSQLTYLQLVFLPFNDGMGYLPWGTTLSFFIPSFFNFWKRRTNVLIASIAARPPVKHTFHALASAHRSFTIPNTFCNLPTVFIKPRLISSANFQWCFIAHYHGLFYRVPN